MTYKRKHVHISHFKVEKPAILAGEAMLLSAYVWRRAVNGSG